MSFAHLPAEPLGWDDWAPEPASSAQLAVLVELGAPLREGPATRDGRSRYYTKRWCAALLYVYPAGSHLARAALARLLRDPELLAAFLAVLSLGTWDAACEFVLANTV